MKHICLSVIWLFYSCSSFAADACLSQTEHALDADLVLRKAWLTTDREFVGEFELSNVATSKGLVLRGTRRNGELFMDYPQIVVETLDARDNWNLFREELAGSFLMPPDSLALGGGKKLRFVSKLVSQHELGTGAVTLRVILHTFRPDGFCIMSIPFHAVLTDREVTGFVSSR